MSKQRHQSTSKRQSGTAPRPHHAKALGESADTARLVPEHWQFVAEGYHQCSIDEKRWLLEYEYARESVAYDVPCWWSAGTWKQVFGDRFPLIPFLSINPIERRRLLEETSLGGQGKPSLFGLTRTNDALWCRSEYSLNEEPQARLEALVEHLSDDLSLVQPQRQLQQAASEFKRDLPEDAYDKSVAHVDLIVRLDYSDDKIKEAFAEMLTRIRGTHQPQPSVKDETNAKLKRLAAARLWRIFGTAEKARSYAFDQGFDNIYKDPGGWTRARDEVWQHLGVNALPEATEE